MQKKSLDKFKLLDCTLRDGGRIIDCQFSSSQIHNIVQELTHANVNIIELGFLDCTKNRTNSTYFTDIRQTAQFIPDASNSFFTVFANFGRFDFNTLPIAQTGLPQGIRIGFTKNDFQEDIEELQKIFHHVKDLGYTVFMQPLDTPAYNDEEFILLIKFANEISPNSFAIVDTYGSMFEKDLEKYYSLVEKNLHGEINLDFHSHNNLQLSFALTIWLLSHNCGRNIIIDSTLLGMGRGGGNLNTEVIAQYLNHEFDTKYDLHKLINIIEAEILPIKKDCDWGYSLPAFLGGIYHIHPSKLDTLYQEFKDGKN